MQWGSQIFARWSFWGVAVLLLSPLLIRLVLRSIKAGKNLINLPNDHICAELLYSSTFSCFMVTDTLMCSSFCPIQYIRFDKTLNKIRRMKEIPLFFFLCLFVSWLLCLCRVRGKSCIKQKPKKRNRLHVVVWDSKFPTRSLQVTLLFCGSKAKTPIH